ARDDDVGLMAKVQEMPRPILKPRDRRRFWHTMEALARAAVETRKPTVFITPIVMPSDRSVMKLFKPAGVTVLKGLHTSLVALRNVQQWARHQENLSNDQVTMRSNQLSSPCGTAIPELKPEGAVLHERLAKDLLK